MTRFWATILLCCMMSGLIIAQEEPADNMTILLEKLKADKKLLVAENMGLTDAESKSFWPLYDDYQKALTDGQSRYGNIVKRYAENYESMTNEQAKGLLDEYMKMEEDQLKMRQSFLPKLRAALPEIKVVRYLQIENKIRSAINYEVASLIPLMK